MTALIDTKERPIIFSGEMVRAILGGRKTQTRRVVKPQPPTDTDRVIGPEMYEPATVDRYGEMVPGPEIFGAYDECAEWGARCPYGHPGDVLWVRETWGLMPELDEQLKDDGYTPKDIDLDDAGHVGYRADSSGAHAVERWRPSIHMPKWACRLRLEVTGVRVERVQAITEADALAEGIQGGDWLGDPVGEFAKLWDSINAKRAYGWAVNPWVWVVEFRLQ